MTTTNDNNSNKRLRTSNGTPALLTTKLQQQHNDAEWQEMINKAVKSIVSIRFSQTDTFDTDSAVSSEASGFVIDAKNGYILTNRHVTCSGPFIGEAIFHDHEEVDVKPIYRDPIHDFGFLKFDPLKIKYQTVTEIQLSPSTATIGLEIRVVGNDAGEKLSILAGSISRLDRNVPDYGELTYNDFNTFYIQSSASTSGGSSGSPVLDINGKAVCLQAGGHTQAATDFFFPLDRVERAFRLLKKGKPVPRGTIQTQFYHRPFDEVRRLGLSSKTEADVRSLFPDEIGMLVVETVVPQGPADKMLEEGDVLISVNNTKITKFVPLEDLLDNNVEKEIKLIVERGGVELTFTIPVQDLHSITPDRFVTFGGARFNTLSYQLARQYALPASGVFIYECAGIFRLEGGPGWIISSIDSKPTPTLDEFINVIGSLHDNERVPITYYSVSDIHFKSMLILTVEFHWSQFNLVTRNDKTGLWDYKKLGKGLPPKKLEPETAKFAQLDESLGSSKVLFKSIVKVSYYMPIRVNGFPRTKKYGSGVVVAPGIVVVGRNIVPFDMGDLWITIADSVVIPGKVKYIHPQQNVAFISYDTRLTSLTPLQVATISPIELVQGHKVTFVALNSAHRPICVSTTVTDISNAYIPLNLNPRFRAINFDGIGIDTPLAQSCSSGVLADSQGRIQALWLNFLGERNINGIDHEYNLGIRVSSITPILDLLKDEKDQMVLNDDDDNNNNDGKGKELVLRGLGVELKPVLISQARQMGLSSEWVDKVEQANPHRPQLFLVSRMEIGSPTSTVLQDLDLILTCNEKVITRVSELEPKPTTSTTLNMTILRNKVETKLNNIPSTILYEPTPRVILFCGAVLQNPHRAVLQQSKHLPSEVYVVGRSKGSPSYMYGLAPTSWITHVNSIKIKTLDEFLKCINLHVNEKGDNTYLRVKVLSFDFVPAVISIKLSLHYFPTVEIKKYFGRWIRKTHHLLNTGNEGEKEVEDKTASDNFDYLFSCDE